MDGYGTILVADDEVTFLQSTAYLLRNEGYQCDCASDAHEARQRLTTTPYDLLIADINMPGNEGLSLIRDAPRLAQGMPIIVVTGYPTIDSAIDSVHLPVVAYLTKPLNMAQLLDQVHTTLEQASGRRTVTHLRQQLALCVQQLATLERSETHPSCRSIPSATLQVLDLVLPSLADTLRQLHALRQQLAPEGATPEVCQLLHCAARESLHGGLRAAIQVIEQTKAAFKSKDLANLRVHLQHLLQGPVPAGSPSGPHLGATRASASRLN